ncbi:serine protease inhibitor swm-1-like [Bicyclus anynana]|uniref:Serine protease inhibitor swm-1-like n=1 Tax=Bicyclus anynana TaxID=110368 RepID=A0ABM3LWU2_BICAN|nr:serine protease inhibitor swm-1-like [Bicyclus anynana]
MLKFAFIFIVSVSICGGVFVAKGNCPTNEEFLLCGSACQQNCSNLNPGNCTDCIEGCFCLPGFLRNENGTCVNAGLCAAFNSTCGANEEFLACGKACPATCAVPEPEVCGLACSVGCFCTEGFYRDEVTGRCVTLDNCSASDDMCFNSNEVYDICNANCEPTCAEPEPICAKLCKGGCICAPGLLRSPGGECVSVDKCPPSNGTAPDVLNKYLTTINKILHLTAV